MTRRFSVGLTVAIVACLAFIGSVVVMGMLTGEYWCVDRSPWWGPPEDPGSTCTGEAWAGRHPDDYPWTMPR